MYIKINDPEGNENKKILNLDISGFSQFFSKKNTLVFGHTEITETSINNNKSSVEQNFIKDYSIGFTSEEEANIARDRIYQTLGLKSPYNTYVDLTKISEDLENNDGFELTMEQIADKYKVDLRKLKIVDATTMYIDNADNE